MEGDAATSMTFYLKIPSTEKRALGAIRHWSHLKIAVEPHETWVKGFTESEIRSVSIRSLVSKELFYEKEGQRYLLDSLLPSGPIPNVLWTSIDRGLPLSMSQFNHNYFGIQEKISPRLVPGSEEQKASVLKTSVSILGDYLKQAPMLRLAAIEWLVTDEENAWLFGTPLLPLPGTTYWQQGNLILPSGYQLELPNMNKAFSDTIDAKGDDWIIFQEDGGFFSVKKAYCKPLTLGAFRLTLQQMAKSTTPWQ